MRKRVDGKSFACGVIPAEKSDIHHRITFAEEARAQCLEQAPRVARVLWRWRLKVAQLDLLRIEPVEKVLNLLDY